MAYKKQIKTRVQPHALHGIRVLLTGFLIFAVFLVKLGPTPIQAIVTSGNVLAYATDVSHTELLSATNSYRTQNGLAALTLNSKLNSAAQQKAQHMVDNDYWAHVAPDGTQPWYFFDLVGYSYTSAGENLAYGFSTSSSIVNAWINSPPHRDNIVGDYADVGFGYVNGSNYQAGQYTVVVAHYGKTAASPEPVAPVAPATPPQSVPAPAPTPTPDPTPVPVAAEEPVITDEPDSPPENEPEEGLPEEQESPLVSNQSDPKPPILTGLLRGVSVLQQLGSSAPPAIALSSIGITVAAAVGFALTHRSLMRHAVANGEKFVVAHPAFDATAIAAAAMIILSANAGFIG